jgi:hypothetical protein
MKSITVNFRREDCMAINIIEIYLKNEPGSLCQVTEILEREAIDMYCIANSGEEEYIPVSMVVSHIEKAVHEFSHKGYEFDVEEAIALEVPHHPGGLNSVLRVLSDAYINIISIFSATSRHTGDAVIILRVNDTEKAEDILKKNWIKLLDIEDFFK